jgi:hypothetical protein
MLIFGHKATTKFGCPFNFGLAQISYSHLNFSQKFIPFDILLPVAIFFGPFNMVILEHILRSNHMAARI